MNEWIVKKKKMPNEVFDKYEKTIINWYESGELTRARAKELLVEFYMEYERERK